MFPSLGIHGEPGIKRLKVNRIQSAVNFICYFPHWLPSHLFIFSFIHFVHLTSGGLCRWGGEDHDRSHDQPWQPVASAAEDRFSQRRVSLHDDSQSMQTFCIWSKHSWLSSLLQETLWFCVWTTSELCLHWRWRWSPEQPSSVWVTINELILMTCEALLPWVFVDASLLSSWR